MVKYLHQIRILKLEERFRPVGDRKDDADKFILESESIGWWALLDTDPRFWVFLGQLEPAAPFEIHISATWRPT